MSVLKVSTDVCKFARAELSSALRSDYKKSCKQSQNHFSFHLHTRTQHITFRNITMPRARNSTANKKVSKKITMPGAGKSSVTKKIPKEMPAVSGEELQQYTISMKTIRQLKYQTVCQELVDMEKEFQTEWRQFSRNYDAKKRELESILNEVSKHLLINLFISSYHCNGCSSVYVMFFFILHIII